MKKILVLMTVILLFSTSYFLVHATSEEEEVKPYADDWYVTTEDIIWDIIFPVIEKRVIEELGDNEHASFGWGKDRITNIVYNNNHSYDISIRIKVPNKNPLNYVNALVTVRVSPSCESPKISCEHGFSVEVVEYKPLTQ